MRPVFGWMLCFAAVCAIGAAALAQQRFTSTTSLLTLDVSALDRDGKPVTDLGPGDLVVTLNGEHQSVRSMVFLATRTTRAAAASGPGAGLPASPPPAEAAASNAEPDPRLLVVMVDDLSIFPTESKGLLVAAERFVDAIPPRDWVGLATTSGIGTVNPSLDRAPMLAKLRHTFGRMDDPRRESQTYVGLMDALLVDQGSETQLRQILQDLCDLPVTTSKNLGQILAENRCAHEVERQARSNATFARNTTRNQLDAYAAVIKAMASAPGVKQLVVLTGGVALAPRDSADFIPVAKAAAAAGVQITMMMEEPDDSDLSFRYAGQLAKDQRQMLQQAQTLAELTGGQFFRVVGQADRFYQRVLTATSAVYRIGVDVPAAVPSDGQYTVKIAVNRPGVKAFASRYAVPPLPPVAVSPDEQVTRAIRTGQPLYAVPVRMSAEVVTPEGGAQLAIRISLDVPGHTPAPLSGMFGMIGPDQRLVSGRLNLILAADGTSYHQDILVPAVAATYDIRVAVADGSGAVGAVAQKVVVK
jgi:VWFA-related protein